MRDTQSHVRVHMCNFEYMYPLIYPVRHRLFFGLEAVMDGNPGGWEARSIELHRLEPHLSPALATDMEDGLLCKTTHLNTEEL